MPEIRFRTVAKMFEQQNILFVISVFLILAPNVRAQPELQIASSAASAVYAGFLAMAEVCMASHIPNQHYKMDNLKGFINYPALTTVGVGHKMSSNRKFFANLISTRGFKDMLDKDVVEIRKNLLKKMKYCEKTVMNKDVLKDFYDREVDQTKL